MTTPESPSRFARIAVHVARILLGLVFFVFGLGALLNWFPPPPPETLPPKLVAFDAAMRSSGYLFGLVKGTETAMGVLLLLNRFVPLALVILAPVIVNIVLVNLLMAPFGLPVALVVLALEIYLAWAHRRAYAPLLTARFV
ncbi:MAG: DoxX family membrane protein [Opitutae bacterium]|nr:DoxX family membrane protein [Opitutae bacterium]